MPDDEQTTKKKTRVLFSLVGKRDPYSEAPPDPPPGLDDDGTLYDYEGSVLTVCRKVRPDILYLFPSGRANLPPDDHTQDRADEIKAIVKGWRGGPSTCAVRPLNVTDPANVEEVYGCFQPYIIEIITQRKRKHPLEAYEFFVDTTSGTFQMAEAARLCIATHLPLEPTYCQCIEPKYAKDGARVVFPKPLLPEVILLKQIEDDVEGYRFHSLIDACKSLMEMTKLPTRRDVAGALHNVFSAYEKMDFMQYGKAYSIISGLRVDLLPQKIGVIIEDQVRFLDHVKGDQVAESVYSLVDLYFNMERAFARGNYVDVLARFWRLREGMMYYRLLKRYKDDVRNLDDSPSLGALVSMLVWDHRDNEFKDFEDNKDRQCDYIDPRNGRTKRIGLLERLRLARNSSIVAHGMAPVQKEEAKMCLDIGKEIVELIPEVPEIPGAVPRIPGGQEIYNAYPFTLANLKTLADMLKRV